MQQEPSVPALELQSLGRRVTGRLPTETLRKQAHCATGYRRRQQARRDARGTPQRVKCARALPTGTTALPPAAARTFGFAPNPKRGAVARGTQQHGALTGLVGLSPTPCCRAAGFVPRCRTEFESAGLPGFFDDHSISATLLVPVIHSLEEVAWNSLLEKKETTMESRTGFIGTELGKQNIAEDAFNTFLKKK
ncbi:PREDICTED: uncharacterized protein LOC103912652 isoform X2 [Pygoscelis adeliae]|uniref:uncharacterized protein LOC103912652 isoform X2 n=1 Tax=Pygoscelis adeliae TaxID=9238 RepID=UPI0004F4F290|nr:PREDICTED: uncharacterized protein LOC103912652 isoform X2 [Pygoscelis adeliae]